MEQHLCSKCGKYRIENKTHKLCHMCNYLRLHGMTPTQRAVKKRIEKRKEKVANLKYHSITKKSFISDSDKKCSVENCTNDVSSIKSKSGDRPDFCDKHLKKWYFDRNRKKTTKKKTSQAKREQKVKSELSILKQTAKRLKRENGNVCEGCLKPSPYDLDYSHILSVGQRKDLENEKDNKNMLCRDCHRKWESSNAEQMLSLACFMDNMKYIRRMDESRFWKIYFILNDAMMIKECNELEKIDDDYKKNN